ncbi:nesprin-2 isoform X3 [Simochromis diagramma]|uniref:nesprin-2 isoform X3 n=1 Tax=Simochromis diagramma TaxID=43689 RepID=UPI001A7EEE58|nr:nesprin-2 isoform X3 [Simochromis diagramma]
MVVSEVKSPSEAGLCLLPWARRTRVGRRNLLTTASSGSANGLQVISDRLADNFSILAGHHATGDNGDDGGEDGDGVGGDDSDGLEKDFPEVNSGLCCGDCMASGEAEEGDGGIPLDIDNVHMLLQVEHEQIQKRTFTNWINAQLAKGSPPSFVSDLFCDLRDGSKLLDLLEVMSGQMMKRQKGRGVFQQRANIETALKFLKKKNVKLVNINIPDIIDGRPSIILGLVWTVILHCHIEELASALSFSSRHSSLDSLSSLDSWSSSPVPASPVPAGRTSPLHRRFRVSAKKALLMWVRDQCKKVHCSVNVKDFKSSWRSGEVFLAILSSLRPQLVDLSLVQSRSNQENLEEAFHLAEQELHIPRLLEPQDVDVSSPDEKSIMTYVAQFLQYSSDMPAPDDHLQLFPLAQPSFCSPETLPAHFTPAIAVSPVHEVSPSERAQQVTCWLEQAYQELSDSWKAAENSSYAEKYQVLQSLAGSFTEQRRPVMTLLAALRRRPELSQQQCFLRTAWDQLEEELQRCKADLDLNLPPPLDSVVAWLQRAEAGLAEDAGKVKDHSDAAKEARAQQDGLKNINKEMGHYVNILETYHNMDDSGNIVVPLEKFDEIRKRLTSIRVSTKYRGIKLEYQESRHTILDLLSQIGAKVQSWKTPYRSQETIHVLLQDWHETIEHQDLLFTLTSALHTLEEKANVYTSKAALSENFQLVTRQVKEAESEVEMVKQAVTATRGTMERVLCAWETYNKNLASLQAWLAQEKRIQSPAATQDISEWTSRQAQLNEAGNYLIEVTEMSISLSLVEQLSKVNIQWAEYMKKAMFEVSSEPCTGASCLQMVHSMTQEASLLLRQPLEVASVPLKAIRQKLQLLSKKMAEVNVSSLSSSPDFQTSYFEKIQKTLPQMLVEAEGACGELQQAASRLEGGLAELDRWSTDAMDCYNHLKEKSHRGHPTMESTAKGLISRGFQLANQVKTEEQDLQGLVGILQKTSPLQHLSTSSLKDRVTEAVSYCQDILGMFSSLGYKQEVGEFPKNQPAVETIFQTKKQPEIGLLVVARSKHVENIGNIMLQSQHSDQLSASTPQQRTRDLQGKLHDERDIITPKIVTSYPPVTYIQSHFLQSAKEAESELLIQPQSFSKSHPLASSFSENDQPLPATTQTPIKGKFSESPVPAKYGGSLPCQFQTKHKNTGPSSIQSSKPPQPPVMVHREVHSRAQSMARSRLEKARFRLQGRIQQATKLFGGKEISESEAKKKQKALKILQPAMLEEFLCAVEGFGAFCSGSQLQDLMLLSDSVRNQWEDTRREMAAFIPILWSKIREGKQSFSVVQCETHTNTVHTDQTDDDSLQQQQAVTEGAASIEERVESLRELCETLTPKKSSCLATDQLSESDEVEETQPRDAAVPANSRGRQPGGDAPLSATDVSANTQPSNNLPQKQSDDSPHEDLAPVSHVVSVQPHGDILKLKVQEVPTESEVHLTKNRDGRSEQNPKPSLRAKEQLLKARLLHYAESSQQIQTHAQAVVRSNTVETKQEAQWTIIPEPAAPSQKEHPSEQEVRESYRKLCSAFKSQLQENKLLLESFIPDPVSILALQNQKKHLQTLKKETEALWFDVELQYAQFSQFAQPMTREEGWTEVEREQLTQQWREQQVRLETRMASLENIADLMKSADDQKTLITQQLNQITGQPVDISSLTLADSTILHDLKEMDNRLQAGMRMLTEKSTKEESQGPEATSSSSLCRGLHSSIHHFKQLRQQLEKVQSAVCALDRFLTTMREVEAEIQTVLANQDLSKQKHEADWEQEKPSLDATMQRLQAATEQSDSVDSNLKAVGISLTMDGALATCQDVVKCITVHVVEMEKWGAKAIILPEKRNIQDDEKSKTVETCQTKSGNASLEQQDMQEDPTSSEPDEESGLEAKRRKLEGETQVEEEHKTQAWRPREDLLETKDQRQMGRTTQVKKDGEKMENLVQRRANLLATLRETKKAAEQLSLQEPTLPALQHRTRTLTELESHLADLLSEVQYVQGASSRSEIPDESQNREVEDLWEEATKAVTQKLEQCGVLTELLKRFQSIRGKLSTTLQRAESAVSEKTSYMGKEKLQRLHTKVQETKAELNSLGDGIEEVRSVCRQLHTHLRQIPECTCIPFESEADAVMDHWLDLSERTESCLENLHLALTLWDGVLQQGSEVERWTSDKVAVFAQCPSFQCEDDIKALQNEIVLQEESIQHFHRRATEIQTLLQSAESPPELQVVGTQMRKKIEQLKELVSEAEDVYKQMVITKGQITGRMEECFNSLQKIENSLLTLCGPDVADVLAKLKELCQQLQSQDEQAESLLEDVHVLASITGPDSLQSLSVEGIQLQEKVRKTHQLFSEVEEQTERNMRDLDRLQIERDHLEQWLHAAEEKTAKEEDQSLLEEEALQQRVRTELLSQLVSSLQRSNLQQLAVVENSKKLLERYNNSHIKIQGDCKETHSSLREEIEVFQALFKSTQSWISDLRQAVDSPLAESPWIQTPLEQKLHCAQAVLSAELEGEARLEELRVTGDGLCHRVLNEDDLKREVQDTVQRAEEKWRETLQSVEPYYSALKADPEVTCFYLDQRRELCHKVEVLQRQKDQLPTLFPCPGTAERKQGCRLALQLQEETESLQLMLSSLSKRRYELTEQTRDSIWKDSSWDELYTHWSTLMAELKGVRSRLEEGASNEEQFGHLLQRCCHKLMSLQERISACQGQKENSAGTNTDIAALEVLLQEVTGTEKDLLQLVTLKDSITVSLTAEAQISLTQQVSNLQNHKRALESKIRETLARLQVNSDESIQRVKKEALYVQTALKDLAEGVCNLSNTHEALPDISQLKQQWCMIQSCDSRLTELAARAEDLQRARESTSTQEALPADIILTVSAISEDLGSLRSVFLQKKQDFAENTANRVRELTNQMQEWCQREQAEPSTHSQLVYLSVLSQGALDEDLQLQQALYNVLSEQDFLLNCLGTNVAQELEKNASGALTESQSALETQSKHQVIRVHGNVQLENKDLPSRSEQDSLRNESGAPHLASSDKTTARQIPESMEPERTAPGSPADLGSKETPSGPANSGKEKHTMQDIFSDIQNVVERSNIINRTPHIDLNWYLKSSPGEQQIQLVRTVQKILACRYQPAQLSVIAMTKQLEEAKEYQRTVQEQVATLKNSGASKACEPSALNSAAGQWSAALLDASATLQVKAAQLEQVKQYHKQMKLTRAFLEVIAAEKEKTSLHSLGSSALQAEKLHVLLQTMEHKKAMMEGLLRLSSQLSVHLSDAESSGALLGQLGNVQEEWRLLKGSIKRALRHASNSTCQSSLLLKEAEQLKAKLEALQKSDCQNLDSKSALECVCLTTDLKLYNQLYIHLQSQSDALNNFSLGQKEKDEIEHSLQELASLLGVTKRKLDSVTLSCGDSSPTKINKQLRDLIVWAKQAENHISIGKKLALFPEEARIQIVEMRKFQADILSRQSKMRVQVDEMKELASNMENEESDQVLRTVEDLYEAIADSLDLVLDTMEKDLKQREKLLCELASMDAWLAETHAKRNPCAHIENISKVDLKKLENDLKSHELATVDIESQLELVEVMSESCRKIAIGLSPAESRYLVNRLSGLWTELDGLLAHEKATSWELKELIHECTTSDEELSSIQASLKQISADLEQLKIPLTQETLSVIAQWKHMLMEHQCQIQELQHCLEPKRSSVLCFIGELEDRFKALSISAFEQEKFLHLKTQMEESKDIVKEQIQNAKNKALGVDERFKLCQTVLVEIPLVKTQSQEATDQLEVIAQELHPSVLHLERERIHYIVDTLESWETLGTDDIKNLEAQLLLGLQFDSELPAYIELLESTRVELEGTEPVSPEETAIDIALQRYWVIWRSMESGMRVLENLGQKEKTDLRNYKELYSLRDSVMQECHSQMVMLSQARESLKDYHWAAQGAIRFLHNAEATFLSATGGFLDCAEEQRQTQEALETLEKGFHAHICHLVERVPREPCLSFPKTEQLHINILSQLMVGRAILEAQAQLRLETLQRCELRQQSHQKCHKDICQHLSQFEERLSECAAEHVTSYDKCVAQQRRAQLLMEDLHGLAGRIDDLRAVCPMQGCGVGKDGEVGALWRHWLSLLRDVGLLMVRTEQKGEEWKDITASMEQCCSFLARLQAEVRDPTTVNFTGEDPQELLALAEILQTGLEQEQQDLASLEHRLEHALSLSSSPGPIGKMLVKIQDNVRSLKERNLLVVAAAQDEERERRQVQEEMGQIQKHVFLILPALEACLNPSERQELRKELSSQKTKLKCITDSVQSRYTEVPVDIGKQIQDLQMSLQRAEEKLIENSLVKKLASRVLELGSGMEKVKALLEQRSPTVSEAQNVLKHVWDELDAWHSSLMLLESEVQDLAEEQPDQAQLLIDQLTQPQQLYQDAAQMVEQRTTFLSKIPKCLQELEDILHSATRWLGEAQSWLSAPCSFTTAKSLHNHAKSLQLVLDDSEMIRGNLQDFRLVLGEISAVCDISAQEERLEQNDQQVLKMQGSILEPLEQLLQAVVVVEDMEAELKTVEKNVLKIRTILSSMDDSNMSLTEHLHNRQVIQDNLCSMQRMLEDLEKCKGELHIPQRAEEGLQVYSKARLLLQSLEELEHLTQQQASLLENKIREEEETSAILAITTGSHTPGQMQQLHTHLVQQGAFEVSNSEEEEDEDDESCHSSSSDTLTSSIPEDPEDTLKLSEVQREDMAEHKPPSHMKDLEGMLHQSSKCAEKPELDINFEAKQAEAGKITPDAKADFDVALTPESVTAQSLNTAAVPAAEGQLKAAAVHQHDLPKHEAFDADPRTNTPQAAAGAEDTRLIPSRPITPFAAGRASDELIEEEKLSLSTAPNSDLDVFDRLREQTEVSTSCFLGGSQQFSVEPISLPGHENVNPKRQRWSHLHSQISEKITTLKKVKENHQSQNREDAENRQKVPDEASRSIGSTCAALQHTQEAITMLRKIVSSTDGSHPGVKEEFYEAIQQVLLCLDSLTDLLLTCGGTGEDEPQLRLLQHECISAELGTLSELMSKVVSETRPQLSKEEPDAYSCLTCLQDCLHTAQLVLTSSHNQLIEDPGLKDPCKEISTNQLCLLDEFELGQSRVFPNLKDGPSSEVTTAAQLYCCVLARHLRESPGEKAKMQHSSRSLLQGITRLLELGEECIRERKMSQVHSCSKLQAVLCTHKKLLQVLRSQMAFVQYLSQHEPEALKCQENERVHLEARAKSLQQQALEQEVASQRRLQEWTRWEDNCGRLGRVLDESEAFISRWEPEGDDDEEELVQHRLDACQQTLVQLDDNKATLGAILDQGKVLQAEPLLAASTHQTGGALELRWRNAYRRTEKEIQRCRDIQDSQIRFHTNFDLVSEWLAGANKHLKTLSGLVNLSDLSQECVQSNLIKLLDFSMEVERMSVLKTSASKDAAQLLQLREADCPGLRTQLTQLENSWNQLTSDMSKTQDQLQQCLLAAQPSMELLSDLEDWLKQMKNCMNQEKEKVLKASSAAQVTEILQNFQVFKAAVTNGQLLLHFLCQPRPQMADIQAVRSERTTFAEELGASRLQWLHFQRELESQICGAEQIHRTCAERERRLQCLHGWIEQQKKQLNQWKQPTSQTLAHKALLEWEALEGRVKEVAAALQELKTTQVYDKREQERPCDVAFSNEAEGVSHACRDLSQEMKALRPALQQVVEKWSCFHRDLRDVTLHTTRVRCAFQHQQAPLFLLKQAEGYVDFLLQLQEEAGKGEALWAAVNKSCQSLVGSLHHGAAQALRDEVEGEQKRWQNTVQEIKEENIKTEETLLVWQEYTRLSCSCSAQQKHLQHEWEELSRSSLSAGHNTQAIDGSVKKLQGAAEELQSIMGDVLAASKPLIGRLEPLPANLIGSETRLLSRGILLLNEAIAGKKRSVEEDLEQRKLFHAQLEVFKKQMQDLQQKLKAGKDNTDSVKQVLQELCGLFPSLLDIRDMSGHVNLNKQESERLHVLIREWVEVMTRSSDRELQDECQRSLSFQEKSGRLTQIKEKLEQEAVCRKNPSYPSLQEMLIVHQRLQADIIVGHQLLQHLLCDAIKSMEKETGEKRSELTAQVVSLKNGWFSSVALAGQSRTLTKEQLHQWRIYKNGLKHLWKLLRDADSLLPPTGRFLCAVDQLQNCVDDYQCITESLDQHSAVYTQTLKAGKHLCETMKDSECYSRLQSEFQAIDEAWQRTTSLLRERRDMLYTTVKMWSRCQDGISNIVSEMHELKMKQQTCERPEDSALIQETELSLQHLAIGLKELANMKTDLSQYVTASDSALLEKQLEQLHSQWEELCMKVSSRKQEIADRLNAWTIFNDKNKEFCDWLTQMEHKVCHRGELSIKEMVEKLKKDCMEEINLFSENKSHLKQLGEQLLLASDEAKQVQVHESLQEVNQRWHNLFHQIEARVKKLKETLVTMQQLDKNMSNLRSWLSRIEAELSRPITYSVCHEQEIQRRLAEQQELQRDIEKHTEGVASVLSLCDVLLRDEDATGGTEAESDSLQETSRSLDQRWRTICAMALNRKLRIEETWTLWCKFLNDYSRFEDWLKMAERTAANPNSADVLFTVAKEELKKFEGFQRQVHERLTQLELVNNQYRRLARENRTDRASQLKAMVHEGNRRWDTLHRRVAAILHRLKYFTSQREEFEGTRESLLVWLTNLDLQLTNVEHFSESDVHQKIQQLNSFQKEITLNTERIDGLIVFGEGLIQKSSPQDAAKIEEELEELHSYCQEVFRRLVRFHQRLSQPPITEEPEIPSTTFSLESSLELIGRPWLGRSFGSLPATPTLLLSSPLVRSGRETPDSLALEWDHTVDVGGSSSHEDDEEEEENEEEGAYFSALSEVELTETLEEFIEASEAPLASSLASSRSVAVQDSPRWRALGDRETESDTEGHTEATPTLTSTPLKPGYLSLMSECSRSIESINRVSLILDDVEQPEEFGLMGLSASDKQSGVIERWELLKARSRCSERDSSEEPQQLRCDLDNITSWLKNVIPELDRLQEPDPAACIEEMEARAKELKEMQKVFTHYKSIMLSVNLRSEEAPEAQEKLTSMNRDWSRACTGLQQWDLSLRKKLMQCQDFHESLHSLLLWLAHAESRRYAVDIGHPDTTLTALQQHSNTLTALQKELQDRQAHQASLQTLWSQLQPEDGTEESNEAREKLHVTGSKLKLLLKQVDCDLSNLRQRLDCESATAAQCQSVSQEAANSKKGSSTQREKRESSPPRSFFYRALRAAFPLQLLLLLLLLLPCLIPMSESDSSCTLTNNFARSFYPMLHYTNGPPPT